MPDLVIRPYDDADLEPVLALLAASLGKTVDDRYRGFFRWKHLENPFGRSFMWVAEVEGRIAGFRSFLRWRFIDPGGDPVEVVRAVDTATHPDFQGIGIFRKLTLHGLDEMRPHGIQFVFNTPNDQSRPGYLKMGWTIEGRVPVKVRPRSFRSLWRMGKARTAAEVWSLPIGVGVAVADVVPGIGEVRSQRSAGRLVTDRTREFLSWRYAGFDPIVSRAVLTDDGAVILRLRRRGDAIECTVGDVVGQPSAVRAGAAVRSALRSGRADYAIATASSMIRGMQPIPRLGPIQTRRTVSPSATALPLALSLGDVEMF